jgi:signal transduction histidine kinase
MAEGGPVDMACYSLPLAGDASAGRVAAPGGAGEIEDELPPKAMLLGHARWFCRLRWVVIAVLLLFGLVGRSQDAMAWLYLRLPGLWPLVTAAVLTVSNVFFRARLGSAATQPGSRAVLRNLWGQIVVDLLVLAAVVHFIGSTETYVAFVYLFHIVLACVVLPSGQSLLVTVLAIVLYGGCVLAEQHGLIAAQTVFAAPPSVHPCVAGATRVAFNTLSAMALWLAAWHLTSRLCRLVRRRDMALARTNRRLLAAQAERARHMLATTHQLRSPFAAIAANAQVLREGYCGELPQSAVPVVDRIIARCHRLAGEIQEMLQLANLNSTGGRDLPVVRVDLAEVWRWCQERLEPLAQGRSVTIRADIEPAEVMGVQDHLKMLLFNVIHNAVTYSHEGGLVRVTCRPQPPGGALVRVADDGIGIAEAKLPHIFDEHYRTVEAMRHQRESSGLGLAIVRDVARLHGIGVSVASRPGAGTTVELRFPVTAPKGGNIRLQ